jgi:alpha-maltose-1-phosphate synthase
VKDARSTKFDRAVAVIVRAARWLRPAILSGKSITTLTFEHGPDTGRAHDDATVDTTELYRPGLEGTAFAFEFHSDAHVVSPRAIIGRHVAGAELLETVLESDGVDRAIILGDAEDERLFWKSTRKMRSEGIERIKRGDLQGIARKGCLLRSDPGLVDASWGRRLIGENAFSIVGMIHSLTTTRVQEELQNLLTAPVQPWDAMICTSKAGRDSVEAIWESYRCYLERRGMTVPRPPLQLPVIPLGVHRRKFAATEEVLEQARKYRLELDIADQDVVALWLGRLSPLTKAHPTPMLLAMEQAQKG